MPNKRQTIAQINRSVNNNELFSHRKIVDRYLERCSEWVNRLSKVSDVERSTNAINSILEAQNCIRTLQNDGVISSFEIVSQVRHSELNLEKIVLMLEYGVSSEEASQHLKRPEYDQFEEEAMSEQMYEEQRAFVYGPGRQG